MAIYCPSNEPIFCYHSNDPFSDTVAVNLYSVTIAVVAIQCLGGRGTFEYMHTLSVVLPSPALPSLPLLQMWFLSRAGVQSYLLQELANHLNLEKSLMHSIAVDIWWDRLPGRTEDCLPMYSKQRQAHDGM